MDYKITQQESEALYGLPYLPQLLYFRGIRPYMDFASGIVGHQRGISYQSLRESVYIEPHSGYQSGSPSKDQVRRALKSLEKAQVILLQSQTRKLFIRCLLATRDYCVQKQGTTKPPQEGATFKTQKNPVFSRDLAIKPPQAAPVKTPEAATPPVNYNLYIFLREKFEIFWAAYPVKKSKQRAWHVFCELSPSEHLFEHLMLHLQQQWQFYCERKSTGVWLPSWKYPANWLAQRCWEEPLTNEGVECNETASTRDIFWESCHSGAECFEVESIEAAQSNVIEFEKHG